jgi:hypothetical protein
MAYGSVPSYEITDGETAAGSGNADVRPVARFPTASGNDAVAFGSTIFLSPLPSYKVGA